MRIPNRLLEHKVFVKAIKTIGSSTGAKYDPEVRRRAIVVDKVQIVNDERAGSQTSGTAIASATHVLVQPEHWVAPGSLVTVWKGTPQERESEVVATALGKHSTAPSSAQMWLL